MPFVLLLFLSLPLTLMAETTLKLATLYPPGTNVVTSLQAAAEKIQQQTNGEVRLKVYPGGIMGDDRTVLRKMKIGQLQGALVSGSGLDLISKNLTDISQPFQFDRLEQVYAARQSMDEVFRARLDELGWHAYGPLDGGFSYLMSKKQLPDMAAVRGTKLWLPNSSDIQDISREINIDYLVMNIGDVLTAIDTGAVDSLISPPAAAITLNWHSRFSYYTETPVIYTWGMLVLPSRALQRLSPTQQRLVDEVLSDWAYTLDQQLRVGNEDAIYAIGQLLEPLPFDAADLAALRTGQ